MSQGRGRGRGSGRRSIGDEYLTSPRPTNARRDTSFSIVDLMSSLSVTDRSEQRIALSTETATSSHTTSVGRVSASDLEEYVLAVLATVTPSEFEISVKQAMCRDLERRVQKIFTYAKLNIMGGLGNTFGLKDSDVDLCLTNYGAIVDPWKLHLLKREFENAGGPPAIPPPFSRIR
jgi:hypothetical protein